MITAAERQAENKRKIEETSRNTQNQQQPFKRNNVARAYTAGPGDKKPYGGTKPLCTRSDCQRLTNGKPRESGWKWHCCARAYLWAMLELNPNSQCCHAVVSDVIIGMRLFKDFPEVFPEDLPGISTQPPSGIFRSNLLLVLRQLHGHLSTGSIRDEKELSGPIEGTFRQRLYKDPVLPWGARSCLSEERWIIPDVHRLSGNCNKLTVKIRYPLPGLRFVRSTTMVQVYYSKIT
ncbi:hypothetical protein Tco_0445475 [Tanacetum coccineum]